MAKWRVDVTVSVCYFDIEADTEEEAIQTAWEWWVERKPKFFVIAPEEEHE